MGLPIIRCFTVQLPLVQDCRYDEIVKVSKKKRDELVEALIEHNISLDECPRFKCSFLEARAQDVTSVSDLLAMLTPWRKEGEMQAEFSLKTPCLCDAGVSEVDAAALVLKIIVFNHFTSLMKQNSAGQQQLLHWCQEIKAWLAKKPADVGTVLHGALEELRTLSDFFVALTPPVAEKLSWGMAAVTKVRTSAHGSLNLVKTALRQCPFWKALEGQFRTFELASTTLVPEMTTAREELNTKGWAGAADVVRSLPRWLDGLGPELCSEVVDALRDVILAQMAQCKESGSTDGWKSVVALLEEAAAMSSLGSSSPFSGLLADEGDWQCPAAAAAGHCGWSVRRVPC